MSKIVQCKFYPETDFILTEIRNEDLEEIKSKFIAVEIYEGDEKCSVSLSKPQAEQFVEYLNQLIKELE